MKHDINFFGSKARILKTESVMDAVRDIVTHTHQEDSFFVFDAGDVIHKIKLWKLKLPRVKLFYAVKCNNNDTLLQLLANLGTGFDCASKSEMNQILGLCVAPSRIIYAHPCKPASHLRHAAKCNISRMTFDNESELYKVKELYPNAQLVIRIRCDAEKVQCPLGVKFGVDPENVLPLLETVIRLNLNLVGVSFHVGSGCQEPKVFLRAIEAARKVFDLSASLGMKLSLLDIGGGFPGQTRSGLDKLAYYINKALDDYFPVGMCVEVIAEPGRYVVASAFTLATQTISKREVVNDSGELCSTMYYINDGVYGSFNCIMFDHQKVHPICLESPEEVTLSPASIWGPTCDGVDQVVSNMKLPRLELGSWLVWPNMGAYSLSTAGTFNGFPLPLVYVVVPFHSWLYLEDLLGSLHVLPANEGKRGETPLGHVGHMEEQHLENKPLVPCSLSEVTECFSKLPLVDLVNLL